MSTSTPIVDQKSIFGESPANWRIDRIRDRLNGVVGGEWGDDPESHDEGVEIPVVRVADIKELDIETENLTIRRVKASKLPGRLIGQRTLLLEKSGGGEQKPVGRAVLGRNVTSAAICSNFMAKIDCGLTVSPLFIAYLLDAAYTSGINTAHIQQTTGIQNLRVFDYLNTHVAIPPLLEQQRIGDYLDASCAAIDVAVAAKRGQLEALNALRKSTIKRAVMMGVNPSVKTQPTDVEWIPEMPQHWRLVRVKDVMEFFNTVRVPLSAAERGVMTERTYDYYGASGVIDRVESYLFDGTYILVAEDGANLLTRSKPLAFLATGQFWVNNHAHILKPRWGGDETFFVNLLESRDFSLFVTGAAQPKLTMENLGHFKLAVPRVAEQREIASFIREQDAEFRLLFGQIERQIETLVAYRKSLIHECVTGQRRISEADLNRAKTHG
ncbi:MAG: restriction endonuclease subunit S [Nitrospira sp.]|nr:restriction endonuclease subunit S [Nitrospira sp.]